MPAEIWDAVPGVKKIRYVKAFITYYYVNKY
jgi:hypothetical protein